MVGKFFTKDNEKLPDDTKKPVPKKGRWFTDENRLLPGSKEVEYNYEPPSFLEQAGDFSLDTLRNLNNTMTMGLYPKLLEATGVDPEAGAKLEDSNPIAKIIGETGGYMASGAPLAAGVSKLIPALGKYTIPSTIGREGMVGGIQSAGENAVQGDFDPIDMFVDTAMAGGASGVMGGTLSMLNRMLNSGAKIRASGVDLTPADRDAAYGFMKYAEDEGIPLNVSEAVSEVAPTRAPRVTSLFEGSAQAPDGSNVLASFNAARKGSIEDTGNRIVNEIRGDNPPLQPQVAGDMAKDSIDTVKAGFRTAAKPFYDKANSKKIPPSWVPQSGYTRKAINTVGDDGNLMEAMKAESGIEPTPNSILMLDAARDEMDTMAGDMFGKGKGKAGQYILSQLEELTSRMDKMAPSYAEARGISAGGKRAVDELEAGPLGTIARSSKPNAQSNAMFGVTNSAEADAVEEALRHTGYELPTGLLANRIESAVSKSPVGWGKKALPNGLTQDLADMVLDSAGKSSVKGPVRAAGAVKPGNISPTPNEHTGPVGEVWSALRDWGKKGTVEKMLDPETVKTLGIRGALEEALIRLSTSTTGTVVGRQKENRRKRNPQP